MTVVLYESPRRLVKTLEDLLECWGERRIALARELTKVHEEFFPGDHFRGEGALRGGGAGGVHPRGRRGRARKRGLMKAAGGMWKKAAGGRNSGACLKRAMFP